MTENPAMHDYPEIPGLEQPEYWARGARSVVYRGIYNGTPAAVKVRVGESDANDALLREANGLRLVNQWQIGPTLLAATDDYVITKFEFGLHIRQWLPISSSQRIENMFRDLFRQAYLLDFIGYNKGELHRLENNLIIGPRDNPILIDFERLTPTESPKNITQLSQYLAVRAPLFHELGIHFKPDALTQAAAAYKQDRSQQTLSKLMDVAFPATPQESCCGCERQVGTEIEKFRRTIPTKAYSQINRAESLNRLNKSHD